MTAATLSPSLSYGDAARLVLQRLQLVKPAPRITITTPYITTAEWFALLKDQRFCPSQWCFRQWMGCPTTFLPPMIAKLFAPDAPSPWYQPLPVTPGGRLGVTYLIPLPYFSDVGQRFLKGHNIARSYRARLPLRTQYILDALMRDKTISYPNFRRLLPVSLQLSKREFYRIRNTLLQQERTVQWKS